MIDVAPCPNCGSRNLRKTTTDAVGHAGPDLLPGAGRLFHQASFDVVVCCGCGLTRLFAEREAIGRIAESAVWERV
jgi:hypothetical protein